MTRRGLDEAVAGILAGEAEAEARDRQRATEQAEAEPAARQLFAELGPDFAATLRDHGPQPTKASRDIKSAVNRRSGRVPKLLFRRGWYVSNAFWVSTDGVVALIGFHELRLSESGEVETRGWSTLDGHATPWMSVRDGATAAVVDVVRKSRR